MNKNRAFIIATALASLSTALPTFASQSSKIGLCKRFVEALENSSLTLKDVNGQHFQFVIKGAHETAVWKGDRDGDVHIVQNTVSDNRNLSNLVISSVNENQNRPDECAITFEDKQTSGTIMIAYKNVIETGKDLGKELFKQVN